MRCTIEHGGWGEWYDVSDMQDTLESREYGRWGFDYHFFIWSITRSEASGSPFGCATIMVSIPQHRVAESDIKSVFAPK